jgi:hypothetical protein
MISDFQKIHNSQGKFMSSQVRIRYCTKNNENNQEKSFSVRPQAQKNSKLYQAMPTN